MSTALKNIVILIVLIVLTFVGYKYFFASKNETSQSSSQSMQNASPTSSGNLTDANTEEEYFNDTDEGTIANNEYLRQLNTVNGIDFDLALFSDPAYQLLKVSSTYIPDEPKGRINPFAPVEQEYGGTPSDTPGAYSNLSFATSSKSTAKTTTTTSKKLPVPPAKK